MRIRVHAAVIVLTFVPALALVGVPRSALGSPGANDGGTLIVHATFPVEYTSDGDYCGLAGLDDCRDAVIRSDQAAPIVGHVIAAFPRGSIPRLKGIVFGLDYDPGITLLGHRVATSNCRRATGRQQAVAPP